MNMIKTTLVGGIFFLIPFGVLLLVAQELLDLALMITEPISELLQPDDFVGIAIANTIAWATILLACFLAGLLARLAAISKYSEKIDDVMSGIIPGYRFIKTKISGLLVSEADVEQSLFPVTVRMAGGERYGFRINGDKSDAKQTVFLPGAPNPEKGVVMIFASEDVTDSDQLPSTVLRAMEHYGRGL
ncbi:MAG: hypothetical protein ABJI96_15905 [Paracoccaceae bacterium]